MDVHLRELRYFVGVAEELHFTRAAEKLHVSQPALSKQIRQLERDLGFPLFKRDHRSVELTAAGATLLPRAREILGSWDDAVAEAAWQARAEAAVLHVGFQTSVSGALYRLAVNLFGETNPAWTVELKLHSWSDSTAGLRSDASDVAFLWLPVPDQEQLDWQTLRREQRRVALWDDHPLARRDELRIADLLDEPFVALPPSAGPSRDYWLALHERNGHPVRIGAQAESPDATFEAIAARQGIALLSEGNADLYARPGIISRPVVDLSPAELALAWNIGDTRTVVRQFADAAQQAAEQAPTRA